jgi:hypothetical protein
MDVNGTKQSLNICTLNWCLLSENRYKYVSFARKSEVFLNSYNLEKQLQPNTIVGQAILASLKVWTVDGRYCQPGWWTRVHTNACQNNSNICHHESGDWWKFVSIVTGHCLCNCWLESAGCFIVVYPVTKKLSHWLGFDCFWWHHHQLATDGNYVGRF